MKKNKVKTDILLIVPPFGYKDIDNTSAIAPHLGIASIAAVLESNNYNVKIIDLYAESISDEELERRIIELQPKIVGMTATTSEYTSALKIIKIVKKINKEIITILGGPHPTILPNTIDFNYIDYIIIGEGEDTVLELVDFIFKRTDIKKGDIKGITYKSEEKPHFNDSRPLIEDLDRLPFPAYHLLPMDKYRDYAQFDDGSKFATIITSRGCPFRCIYCTSSTVFGHKWRTMSPERIIKLIRLLYDKYQIRHLYFQDDEFTINHSRVERVCDLIINSGIKLKWGCLSRVDHINEQLIKKMSEAGCRELAFGAEVGYQYGLNLIHKRITLDQIRKAVDLAVKHKIFVGVSFIMGFPWEGEKELKQTIKFAKSLKADIIYFQVLVPYPGTEVYTTMKNENLILSDDWDRFVQFSIAGTEPIIKTRQLTNKQLQDWNAKAYLAVYTNPIYIIRKLKRIRNFTHLKRNIQSGYKLIKACYIKLTEKASNEN